VPENGVEPSRCCHHWIFLPLRLSPPSPDAVWHAVKVWGLDYPFTLPRKSRGLGAARLVSTPSSVRRLGSGLPVKVSPTLSSSTSPVSRRALKFCLSPARLPVPPLGHGGRISQGAAPAYAGSCVHSLFPLKLKERKPRRNHRIHNRKRLVAHKCDVIRNPGSVNYHRSRIC
jgi:hypothetical protein